jgi:aryl-phospho-beta-D-glucosidase BglC (GH1 family)
MRGELSHNLPGLVTSGNHILRADTGQAVLLRGVNRSGLEYTEPSDAGFLAAAEFTGDEVREMVVKWRSNIIRLPFNQDWALRGRRGHSAEEYLTSIDQVISWAAALGAYTILDLQWLDADTVYGHTVDNNIKSDNHVAPTPSADTIVLWNKLADRYRDEPAVLFDIFNEPHNLLDDDKLPILVIAPGGEVVESNGKFVGPEQWIPWATRLVAEVRKIRPNGIVLVGGVDWAFDLSGIRVNAPNIVYSAHIYSNRKPNTWLKAVGHSAEVPIFIGEWGGTKSDLKFGRNLAKKLRELGLGWAAWSWVDNPQLIQPPRTPDYKPTPFGDLVRYELRGLAPRIEETFTT